MSEWSERAANRLAAWRKREEERRRKADAQRSVETRRLTLVTNEGPRLWDELERCLRQNAESLNRRMGDEVLLIARPTNDPQVLRVWARPAPASQHRRVDVRYLKDQGIQLEDQDPSTEPSIYRFNAVLEREHVRLLIPRRNGDANSEQEGISPTSLCEEILDSLLPD